MNKKYIIYKMEVVKRERIKQTRLQNGDRVSVPGGYFDDNMDVEFYYGTVQSLFSSLNNKVRVKWDIDGTFTHVNVDDLTLLNKDAPKQGTGSTQNIDNNIVETDFSRHELEASSSAINCVPDKESTTITKSTKLKTGKSKFQLRLKAPSPIADSSDSDNDIDDTERINKILNKVNKGKKSQQKKATPKRKKITNDVEEAEINELSEESSNELDYEDENESEDVVVIQNDKIISEKNVWKMPGWNIDPIYERGYQPYGPRMNAEQFTSMSELQMCFQFLPINFFADETLPATNNFAAQATKGNFTPVTLDELLHLFGLIYSMEVQKLPERRMYWNNSDNGIFKALDYGQVMTRSRFEAILANLQLSKSKDRNQQVLDFIDALNARFQSAVNAGDFLCLDESMIKSFHRDLKGKMKIIRKPRPIGNECKNLCDARSKIVLNIELYEGREFMAEKEHVNRVGATTATCLRLTEPWKGSGRIIVGDSWFGSVKSARELYQTNGLYSILLVKTAYRDYPKQLLRENKLLNRGEWNAVSANIEGVKMMAVLFKDLQEKQFISTCSTSLEGKPRETKHHGKIKRPKVAEQYLQMAAGIDIHNHIRTGSLGLEDVWSTKDYIHRQFAGMLGFAFSNTFLAATHFALNPRKKAIAAESHVNFKMKLANQLVIFKQANQRPARSVSARNIDTRFGHKLVSLGNRKQGWCYYCRHSQADDYIRNKTNFYCQLCGVDKPLCAPTTKRDCYELHLSNGMPSPKYRKKEK